MLPKKKKHYSYDNLDKKELGVVIQTEEVGGTTWCIDIHFVVRKNVFSIITCQFNKL
jgi:hypothetical protein